MWDCVLSPTKVLVKIHVFLAYQMILTVAHMDNKPFKKGLGPLNIANIWDPCKRAARLHRRSFPRP